MILLSIFLSAALDMSLPEFQPQTDLSGNYVIGYYDVSEGEFEVMEVEELPDGLTIEAPSEDVEVSLLCDVSGGDISNNEPDNPSGGEFDDTSLLEVLHDIQMQLRCILFVCIWKFILPLAMKIRDHVFGLKHE